MPVTGLHQHSNGEARLPKRVTTRLFLWYFAVFTVLLLAFALAVHFSFAASLRGQMEKRLGTLLIAGIRSAHVRDGRIHVEEPLMPGALLEDGQGLQWFDSAGKSVASEGLVRQQSGGHVLQTRTGAILDPKTGVVAGHVRASQDVTQLRSDAWRLDEILIIGGLCALAASAAGGRFLQTKSVQPIRSSYERLQEFSANASHELRGPVTAVKSNADAALRDDEGMRVSDRERFRTISQAAQQMARLTEDLLLLARADRSLERELFVVDLSSLLEDAVRLYRADFEGHGIHLQSRIDGGITVYGNPDQIQRIFANLLQNAMRYTPAGGTVELSTDVHRGGVSVRVRDTGIGIEPAQLERIFDRFWRAETVRTRSTGTGLGLPIARALARRHGGDVAVFSTPARGSEFVVTLSSRPQT